MASKTSTGTVTAFAVVILSSAALAIAACVADVKPLPPDTDGGTSADSGAAGGNLCRTYCTEIAKTCAGANRQYRNDDECLKACAFLPQGTEADGAQNTVGCRLRQARAATNLQSCLAAGPYGGGTCGQRCDAFCDIVGGNCSDQGGSAPYNSRETCLEECPKFHFDPTGGEGPDHPAGSNTQNCRMHHAILTLGDKVVHCPHTGVVSAVCNLDAGAH